MAKKKGTGVTAAGSKETSGAGKVRGVMVVDMQTTNGTMMRGTEQYEENESE